MIPTLLIDDEPLARSILKEYLEEFPQLKLMQECNDGFEGLKAIMQHRPELIFLDVQMPKINGFEMLELIEEPPAVIFVTAFDEYAIKAFESHATDYLLKPFSRERFNKAVQKFLDQSRPAPTSILLESTAASPQQKHRVVVKNAGKIKIIPVEDIHYLEAADDYVKICTKEGAFLKNRTMAHFEGILDRQLYVRTHRSFIINVQQITRIEPYEKENHIAILKDGKQIPVSKNGYARLKEVLGL
ncbi:MAG: LytTR family transcriptional regulator DNA-binding domain-containing protein [Chitinophagaceae bacterium]|nr:LytTR family transcriptional regulator DNA-binding domain-containing protein [Chitinophagaceae bacterium]